MGSLRSEDASGPEAFEIGNNKDHASSSRVTYKRRSNSRQYTDAHNGGARW